MTDFIDPLEEPFDLDRLPTPTYEEDTALPDEFRDAELREEEDEG
ncbi:hypothetical protein [Agromyces seonyuensis]|nr:hypothetical protein [Agromyces seonyuensis]